MENDPRPTIRGGKGPRFDISNKMVQELLDSGRTVGEISRELNCSVPLVLQVKRGERRDPKRPAHLQLNGRRVCSCCEVRPVKKGNRFLCEICFRSGPVGEIASDSFYCFASV
jgi:hypothetical protein